MLYVCATPIGNLGDVTFRVAERLAAVDLIAAEDTRHTRKLLSHLGVHTPLTSLFKHNEAQKTEEVLALLREGREVALVTDAGTPGIQDPGMRLITRAIQEGIAVTVLPGPSAVVAALVAAGFEGDGFRFVGYLPRRRVELESAFAGWRRSGGLVVAFETGQRLPGSLATLATQAPAMRAAVCRELTKVHEEVVRGSLVELSSRYPVSSPDATPLEGAVRGEITLVVDLGAAEEEGVRATARAMGAASALLGRGLSKRDTAAALQVCLGLSHREAERIAREAGSE
ncbi:MAG TPA: 16S rRNA (cytidine(1402)-2'-O)-methyltransferase [Thermoleophilia bacterium]|nr:16S rRNA (cytidine(1402)-2'-O)-methyltransferase [Thermoleophilia bacterium]HQG02894.1 16S rRNA (cytidine(1402)-2'-O)-methyltransferase [Thermoleophilia bacterium]HQJ98379.1 16S rRNA (cytidine(1402)-2'-O)-methyltransferase [Thermoleophilia bacterium]